MRAVTSGRAESLPESARSIFRLLAHRGPTTRPRLGAELGLSKPTVSDAVAELAAWGLVDSHGVTQGATGRKAAMYRVSPRAGYAMGVETGSTHVRVLVHTLDGVEVHRAEAPLSRRQRHITPTTVAVAAELTRDAMRMLDAELVAVTLAVPTAVSSTYREPGAQAGIAHLTEALEVPEGASVAIENNVNCAAVAEQRYGAGAGHPTFVYLQVGVKIGLGLIHERKLIRGVNNAAGEPALMPFPWTDSGRARPQRGALEQYLGSTALLRRCRGGWSTSAGPPPRDAAQLFALAAGGNAAAQAMVEQHASDVGNLLAGIVSILDPGLVVLGGGVGQNPLLLPGVRRTVRHLTWPTDVVSSTVGDQATVLGAVTTATAEAVRRVVGVAG